jgi:hypothetical protein
VGVYDSQCLYLRSWNLTLTNALSMWATIFLEFLNCVFVRGCRIVGNFKGGEGVNCVILNCVFVRGMYSGIMFSSSRHKVVGEVVCEVLDF